MIRHTILFKVKSSATLDDITSAIAAMDDLKNKLRGIFGIMSGECQFHDEKSQHFFTYGMLQGITHVISIDFFDEDSLNNFLNNPAFQSVKNRIISIAENAYNGIIGFNLVNKDI